jgi:hypothetical protein
MNARQPPRAFISYAWESTELKTWVKSLSTRLRQDGVEVLLDQWAVAPGDQLPSFMESAIRDNDFVVIICTPTYKAKSEGRKGGVGYEGDIMTAEVLQSRNNRKFIPVLKLDGWEASSPSWLQGRYFIDLRGDPYSEEHYQDLLVTLLGNREAAPAVGKQAETRMMPEADAARRFANMPPEIMTVPPLKIIGIIADQVSAPRNDGTPGSALYRIPFRLSGKPSQFWADAFVSAWNMPPQFTSMHRPGIARVIDNTIVLDGTTLDEVEKYHRNTLRLCVIEANQGEELHRKKQERRANEAISQETERRKQVSDAARRIRFDDDG